MVRASAVKRQECPGPAAVEGLPGNILRFAPVTHTGHQGLLLVLVPAHSDPGQLTHPGTGSVCADQQAPGDGLSVIEGCGDLVAGVNQGLNACAAE